MNKVFTVARREYRAAVRTKSFVVALVLMPVFMFGSFAIQKFTKGKIDTDTKRVAVLDHTGRMLEIIQRSAEVRNKSNDKYGVFDETGLQVHPLYEFTEAKPAATDPDAQRLELSDKVRDHEYFAFIEIGSDAVDHSGKGDARVQYYSDQTTYDDISDWLEYVINDLVREKRFASVGLDRNVVMHALEPIPVDNLSLLAKSADGKITPAKPVNRIQTFAIPFGLFLLMWMVINLTVQPMLHGVIEEKGQKISEVLLGSMRPFDLMLGKLLGSVGIAVTLVGIYLLGGYGLARHYGYGDLIPFHLIGWFVLFQSLAILMYGSLFLAIGACCSEIREVQSLMMPVFIFLMIPFFFLRQVLDNPASSFTTTLSLFPPATPMIMMIRMALPPAPPAWLPIAGVAGSLLLTLLCVWAAGRIFRIGLLLQGKAPKMSEMVRWIFQG